MMWQIPAKTFLVGEYAALTYAPAILLTTKPCFELALQDKGDPVIHLDSPAGQFWTQGGLSLNHIQWWDPYLGRGGLGASGAQFIGCYLASCYLKNMPVDGEALLRTYYHYAWNGEGNRPSGYDIIAQVQHGCVYIDQKNNTLRCYDWVFKDISFILLHTGNKLATHHHLQTAKLSKPFNHFSVIVRQAEAAFNEKNSHKLIAAINNYQQELINLSLVSPTTLELLNLFKTNHDILAAKGCGALGMDVLLLIVPSNKLVTTWEYFRERNWIVLATNKALYQGNHLLELS